MSACHENLWETQHKEIKWLLVKLCGLCGSGLFWKSIPIYVNDILLTSCQWHQTSHIMSTTPNSHIMSMRFLPLVHNKTATKHVSHGMILTLLRPTCWLKQYLEAFAKKHSDGVKRKDNYPVSELLELLVKSVKSTGLTIGLSSGCSTTTTTVHCSGWKRPKLSPSKIPRFGQCHDEWFWGVFLIGRVFLTI